MKGAEMAGMRTDAKCVKCGVATLGFWTGPKGEALCAKDGRNFAGATYTNEADRKAVSLGGRAHSLRNYGSRAVGKGERGVVKGGKVTVRKMTAAERKAAGVKPEARAAKKSA